MSIFEELEKGKENNNSEKNHSQKIAERVTEIREELGYSLSGLEQKLGLKRNNLSYLEKKGPNLSSFLTVISYYHEQGYDLNWILVENNENTDKKYKNIMDFYSTNDLDAKQKLNEINTKLEEFNKLSDQLKNDLQEFHRIFEK